MPGGLTSNDVGECCCGATSIFCCWPCPIPEHDLKQGNPDGTGPQFTLTYRPATHTWHYDDFASGGVTILELSCSTGSLSYFFQDPGIDPGQSCNVVTSFTCNPFVVTFFCFDSSIGGTIYDPAPVDTDLSPCTVTCPPCDFPRQDMHLSGFYGAVNVLYHAGPPAYWETVCFPQPGVAGHSMKVKVFCDATNGSSVTTSIYPTTDCTGTPVVATYGPVTSSTCSPLHLDWDIGGGNHLFVDYP